MNAGIAAWSGLVAATTTCSLVFGQEGSELAQWGPQPGEVQGSLSEHALSWTTPRLNLVLDPWITFRRISGTESGMASPAQEWTEPWDNLRGARFEAQLDGVWELAGSLEEWQGLPSPWDAMWMSESSFLPGWGRAKTTPGGRMDVARARGRSTYRHELAPGDTLSCMAAYAPASWGHLPSALTFSNESASFPQAGMSWSRGESFVAEAKAARWTGTERSPLGGSTESLFRQSDAGWVQALWRWNRQNDLGLLVGSSRERPWLGEVEADSAGRFDWKPWSSIQGRWVLEGSGLEVAGEWASHQGWGLAWSAGTDGRSRLTVSATRLKAQPEGSSVLLNAGTPVSAALRPAGLQEATWRAEVHGRIRRQRLSIIGCAAAVAEARAAEVCVGYEIQSVWPLHASLGVEGWRIPNHPILPEEGIRFRIGLAHRIGVKASSTTFGTP